MNRFLLLKTFAAALFLLSPSICAGQKFISGDSANRDFETLVSYLEETHPDAHEAYGGMSNFKKACGDVVEKIARDSIDYYEYVDILKLFIAGFHDGHTRILEGRKIEPQYTYPVEFETAPFALLLKKVEGKLTEDSFKKVVEIDGVEIDHWLVRVWAMFPIENVYGIRDQLSWMLPLGWNGQGYTFDRSGELTLTLEDNEGNLSSLSINPIPATEYQREFPEQKVPLEYRFLSDSIAIFRVSSMFGREMSGTVSEQVEETLKTTPHFTEQFYTMLNLMKERSTPNLIVDLRGNGGGYTSVCLPSLYMLYGDAVLPAIKSIKYKRKISPLLMEKFGLTLDQFNQFTGNDYKMGDLVDVYSDGDHTDIEKEREKFFSQMIYAGALDYLKRDGKPLYTPRQVYVLTDSGTFSAAFHYAYYFRYCGATLCGVPPSQAPNCYMETTSFKLPETGISGTISNLIQTIFTEKKWEFQVMTPDLMPYPVDYQRHARADDPIMEWLLEEISAE